MCVCVHMCIPLQGMLLFRGCRQLAWVGDVLPWRACGRGDLQAWGNPLWVSRVLHLARSDFVEFGSFVPSRAPAVGFYHPTCRAHAILAGCLLMPAPGWWDPGWQILRMRALVLGDEVGNIPGRGYPASQALGRDFSYLGSLKLSGVNGQVPRAVLGRAAV